MERRRARLPHSDSGRLIWPSVILTSHGAAANAPIATSAIAAAWRIEGLILSAINIPTPRPMAARVTTSNGSSGSCSEVFEMDIGRDIAYHIRRVWEKETAIFGTRKILPLFQQHAQSDIRAYPRRRQRGTLLAIEQAYPTQTIASPRFRQGSTRRNVGAT
jgi:hypothetical protein